jgi:hypothetical protein
LLTVSPCIIQPSETSPSDAFGAQLSYWLLDGLVAVDHDRNSGFLTFAATTRHFFRLSFYTLLQITNATGTHIFTTKKSLPSWTPERSLPREALGNITSQE